MQPDNICYLLLGLGHSPTALSSPARGYRQSSKTSRRVSAASLVDGDCDQAHAALAAQTFGRAHFAGLALERSDGMCVVDGWRPICP